MNDDAVDGRPTKRRKDDAREDGGGLADLQSMVVPVSPPRKRQRPEAAGAAAAEDRVLEISTADSSQSSSSSSSSEECTAPRPFRSPFQLTAVRNVPARDNVDTVTVQDVFGDPRVVECWHFNFCYDLPFLLGALAQPQTVRLHVVHGFVGSGQAALEAQARAAAAPAPDGLGAQHVYLHRAHLPARYGTHHTKMAVFLRSDATAQVVVHTANMLPHDWHNMTQAVWRSPLLPLLTAEAAEAEAADAAEDATGPAIGRRFKRDLLRYLHAYNHPVPFCRPLQEQLARYDFAAVRAVLIGSVPGMHDVSDLAAAGDDDDGGRRGPQRSALWGWAAMKHALQAVPLRPPRPPPVPMAEVVVQVSSMATLGHTDTWLRRTLFGALAEGKTTATAHKLLPRPRFRVVFPTADEVRRSVVGYASGVSIHAKARTYDDQRQLQYMRPMLCHWANDGEKGGRPRGDARRARVMPHIKTYVRFSSGGDGSIDWALLTSANLSRQAWGEAASPLGMMQIKSYELGVLVWPALFAEGATMKPVFQKDTLDEADSGVDGSSSSPPVVPLRMPYSLPLQPYGPDERPWLPGVAHNEPDWMGQRWPMD